MAKITVDGLTLCFPEDWQISQYDQWSFYRNQFARMWNGIKALDLLAVDPTKTAWLIEVKNYRDHVRTKPSELSDEVARKVFDTLAALPPARLYAVDRTEQHLASALLRVHQYRVVLQLEQPAKHSKLRPRAINPADVQQKLRRLLKPVDAHPCVAETNRMGSLAWRVQ